MQLSEALHRVRARGTLTRDEARAVFAGSLMANCDASELGAFLVALAARGESEEEIAGAADALRDSMIAFDHPFPDAVDTCGTGGDGLGTFNLSTAAAIVAAAAGATVIKHGNRRQSSACGSADLLEHVGVAIELSPERARAVLEETGITFLYAPLFHPELRHAAPVRRSLGVRTVFNFLGPLCNPGRVRRQVLGVPEARRVEPMAAVLEELGHDRAYVVHGGGADELTLSGENHARAVGDAPREHFDARALGLACAPNTALAGGDARANAAILRRVLDGEPSPIADAVVLNASGALVVANVARGAADGIERAREAIASGAAKEKLARWIAASQRRGMVA